MTSPIAEYLIALDDALVLSGGDKLRILHEAESHLVDATDDGLDEGLSVDDAQRRAVQRFGSVEIVAARAMEESGIRSVPFVAFHRWDVWRADHWVVGAMVAGAAVMVVFVIGVTTFNAAVGGRSRYGIAPAPEAVLSVLVSWAASRASVGWLVKDSTEVAFSSRLSEARGKRPRLFALTGMAPLSGAWVLLRLGDPHSQAIDFVFPLIMVVIPVLAPGWSPERRTGGPGRWAPVVCTAVGASMVLALAIATRSPPLAALAVLWAAVFVPLTVWLLRRSDLERFRSRVAAFRDPSASR